MAELSDMRFAHTEGVCDLVFAPDGRVVTCGADGEVSGRIMEFCYGQSYQIAVKTKRKSLAILLGNLCFDLVLVPLNITLTDVRHIHNRHIFGRVQTSIHRKYCSYIRVRQ